MKLKIDVNIIFLPLILILIYITGFDLNSQKVEPMSKNISIVSGNSGGTYYYIAAGQAKILQEKLGINVLTQASSGSPVENLSLVSREPQTLGIVTFDGYYFGKIGNKERGFSEKIDNIDVLQIGHIAYLYAITMENREINSFKEIKGLKIGVPPIGSSTYYMALAILNEYGCNEENSKIIPLSSSEQSEALKDGDIDVAFVAGGLSQSTVMDLDFSNKIVFLSLDLEIQKTIDKKYPYWYSAVIPKNTYKNMKSDVSCLTVNTMIVCNKDMDERLAYEITKVLNENTEELSKIHVSGSEWNTEVTKQFYNNEILNFHKGAKKYYNEIFN